MNCPYCDKMVIFTIFKNIAHCYNHNIKVSFYLNSNIIELSDFQYAVYLGSNSITLYYHNIISFSSENYTIKISPDNFYQIIPRLIKLNCLA